MFDYKPTCELDQALSLVYDKTCIRCVARQIARRELSINKIQEAKQAAEFMSDEQKKLFFRLLKQEEKL